MAQDNHPVIAINETSPLATIVAVKTAVPVFIGYTEKAEDSAGQTLLLKPVHIESMSDYERYFGSAQPEKRMAITIQEREAGNGELIIDCVVKLDEDNRSKHILYYAMQMFFENGGGNCFIISVSAYKNIDYPISLEDLMLGLSVLQTIVEPTLIIFPEAQNLKIDDFKILHDAALAKCALLGNLFLIIDMHGGDYSLNKANVPILDAVSLFRKSGIGQLNLKHAAVYVPNLITKLSFLVDESSIDVSYTVNQEHAMVKLAELKNINVQYYVAASAAVKEYPCLLPPSSSIAAIYVVTDETRGVWKTPASHSLAGVINPTINITDLQNEDLNIDTDYGKSINSIRAFVNRGTLVWGGRTLAGNDNEWRYVAIRRFFDFLETSILRSTQWVVFEKNIPSVWARLEAEIERFLRTLWNQDAFAGTKPEHAFYVRLGLGDTMTNLDVIEGRLIVELGIALVRPAEFIALRLLYKTAESI